MSRIVVYAIVKAGGRQEKVSVGDVLFMNKVEGEVGSTIELQPVMLVDGDAVTTGTDLKATVTAEILGSGKGPKINIIKYKNKTGYRKRLGHRQALTRIKITGIK